MLEIPIRNLSGINEKYIFNNYPDFYKKIFSISIDNICLTSPNCTNNLKFKNLTVWVTN